ncbi:DUF2637 domain-containing protein [Streptomyces sp. S07_1.15]|uniref:DUF2637 domain-containing protein n=1 Tax=Streptomyces sp. S07_1.15 TaxID=2873925 RepID=UPI001D1538E0|nr:DUF2637 domain-containing protein [Streptomyces sp. S07_1.15]MCC3653228.1 DUF2637 domain-containing protein [Streptomyces sp. S07_1.15]
MKRVTPHSALAAGAAVVTVALTAAAFWLSYEHLHDVAAAHGLGHAPERAWAWPATVDLFIVAGELLILRASLRGTVDRWAIALAATGSLGSIALNVAGVGQHAHPLDYVVAAVPPVAALLAFGALMRQVHDALSPRVVTGPDEPVEVTLEVTPEPRRELAPAAAEPLVICGGRETFTPAVPPREVDAEVDTPTDRLPADEAMNRIRAAWVVGKSVTEAAELSTRSRSYVHKVYGRLDEERQERRDRDRAEDDAWMQQLNADRAGAVAS